MMKEKPIVIRQSVLGQNSGYTKSKYFQWVLWIKQKDGQVNLAFRQNIDWRLFCTEEGFHLICELVLKEAGYKFPEGEVGHEE